MSNKLKVGITLGDTAGIGPEVAVKAIAPEGITELFTPVVIGPKDVFDDAVSRYLQDGLKYEVVTKDHINAVNSILLVPVETDADNPMPAPGRPDINSGRDAENALRRALELLKAGKIDVLVTAPISKENIQSETFRYPGHTEFLENEAGSGKKSLMILFDGDMRVAMVSGHIPVSEIPDSISKEKIKEMVKIFDATLKSDFSVVRPRIAVLSLNPHAGDGGVLGREEEDIIKPAVVELQDEGFMTFGPYAADGFFGHGEYKKFDGILAMYHDQGLAPFKTVSKGHGVNFTAGLPVIRTSPDHGTAFDIAGKNIADETSMRQAIYEAIDIYRRRKNFSKASANPLKKYHLPSNDKEDKTISLISDL